MYTSTYLSMHAVLLPTSLPDTRKASMRHHGQHVDGSRALSQATSYKLASLISRDVWGQEEVQFV